MTISPLIMLSIVSHGNTDMVTRLLASLQKYEPNTSHFQVILTDKLEDNLPIFDPVSWSILQILRNQKPQGFAYNHNRAFEMSKDKYFAILNPDLVVQQPVFEHLIAGIQNCQAVSIAPQIVDENVSRVQITHQLKEQSYSLQILKKNFSCLVFDTCNYYYFQFMDIVKFFDVL